MAPGIVALVLSVILATADPYAAAECFVRAGWRLVFATPAEEGDPLTCVQLADAEVMLGVDTPAFLAPEGREHRGAGVEVYLRVPPEALDGIYASHLREGRVVTPLQDQPWGERGFHAVIEGYRFLVAA
ncbi:MAG TPA: hypothetical protein VE781_15925 [Kineosporiaceae bacterium]|nr:hypothetical protein [Kineosporiaceae bacterium]